MKALRESDDREPKLSHQIYERIFELIVSGEYPERSRLPSEFELSRRFGASRTTGREAPKRLASSSSGGRRACSGNSPETMLSKMRS